jgi:hypothetical protein
MAQAPACSQKDAENSRRTQPLTASLKSNDIDDLLLQMIKGPDPTGGKSFASMYVK